MPRHWRYPRRGHRRSRKIPCELLQTPRRTLQLLRRDAGVDNLKSNLLGLELRAHSRQRAGAQSTRDDAEELGLRGREGNLCRETPDDDARVGREALDVAPDLTACFVEDVFSLDLG